MSLYLLSNLDVSSAGPSESGLTHQKNAAVLTTHNTTRDFYAEHASGSAGQTYWSKFIAFFSSSDVGSQSSESTSATDLTKLSPSELEKRAESGDAQSQFNLGRIYYNGEGVPQDLAKAFGWFEKAAAQGEPLASFCLGVMYEKGEGVPKDLTKAFGWYEKAAVQGYAEAQLNLGVMYANGEGVTKDFVLAYAWFDLAVGRAIDTDMKTHCQSQMTPQELEEAKQLSSNWKVGEILKHTGQ